MAHDVDEWLCVIKLAQLWRFNKVCEHTKAQLSYERVEKSAVEKVALAFAYHLEEWLVPALDGRPRAST